MPTKGSKKKGRKEKKVRGQKVTSTPESKTPVKVETLSKKWYLLLALIVLMTLVSYSNSFTNQFVFDDLHLIARNRAISGVDKIPRLLGIGQWKVSYRPVRMVSYAIDYTLNEKIWQTAGGYEGREKGLNPWAYHVSNCIYHVFTVLMVFLVVSVLTSNRRIALLAAALFALHPVHTDSVTYLSGRRDILSALFYIAGFYFFLRYRMTSKAIFIISALLAYFLSLGSKEMAVTLPAVFLGYDFVKDFSGKADRLDLRYVREAFCSLKRVVVESRILYGFFFLGALAYAGYKVFIKSPSPYTPYYGDSIFTTFLTVSKIIVHYMNLLVYPIRLNADYSYNAFPLSTSFFEPATLFSFLCLGAIGYVVVRLLVQHTLVAFGVIWFFVTLLPVCHIIPHHELLAEHYLYLPSFGFCLVGSIIVNDFLQKRKCRLLTGVVLVMIVLLFSVRIVSRNSDWKNGYTLWKKTVEMIPQCARAHDNLGLAYSEEGRLDEAISEHKRSIAISPNVARPHSNLGRAYAQTGKLNEAIAEYRRALAIKPRYPQAYYNLGLAYAKKGMLNEAVSAYNQALSIKPFYIEAHTNLGAAYTAMGKLDKALSSYGKALSIDRSFVKAHNNRGVVYYKMGRLDEAIASYRRALEIDPTYEKAYQNLGSAYSKNGNLDQAIVTFNRVLAINPRHAGTHYSIASAYYKRGDYGLAIVHGEKATALGHKKSLRLLEKLKARQEHSNQPRSKGDH